MLNILCIETHLSMHLYNTISIILSYQLGSYCIDINFFYIGPWKKFSLAGKLSIVSVSKNEHRAGEACTFECQYIII